MSLSFPFCSWGSLGPSERLGKLPNFMAWQLIVDSSCRSALTVTSSHWLSGMLKSTTWVQYVSAPNPKGSIFYELAVTVNNMQIPFKFKMPPSASLCPAFQLTIAEIAIADNSRKQVELFLRDPVHSRVNSGPHSYKAPFLLSLMPGSDPPAAFHLRQKWRQSSGEKKQNDSQQCCRELVSVLYEI